MYRDNSIEVLTRLSPESHFLRCRDAHDRIEIGEIIIQCLPSSAKGRCYEQDYYLD
jgi:hypothetical protein